MTDFVEKVLFRKHMSRNINASISDVTQTFLVSQNIKVNVSCNIKVILSHNHDVTFCHAISTIQLSHKLKATTYIFLCHAGDSCGVRTIGGNANKTCCHFPYKYNDVEYFTCTYVDNHKPWCAVTANYDRDGVWGVCVGKTFDLRAWGEIETVS